MIGVFAGRSRDLGPWGARREGSAIEVPPRRHRAAAAVLVRLDRPSPAPRRYRPVVSHGNTLRALVKHLDAIGDGEIAAVEIAHGVPLLYELGPGMRPLSAGRYLDAGN